jgi:hypothetical protein
MLHKMYFMFDSPTKVASLHIYLLMILVRGCILIALASIDPTNYNLSACSFARCSPRRLMLVIFCVGQPASNRFGAGLKHPPLPKLQLVSINQHSPLLVFATDLSLIFTVHIHCCVQEAFD